ncbi:glycosyltransferase family 2 protein [Aestuariibaculum lutulentum]|uniref:Glycosyltransferase family 2 protein n=1 Tax=Aestuariibaculum lutulentum TaxID=2920935 RepID=A0ABS9RE65_9FLAO|nr:glycosyltransferase family 2 protein [Aestuariibaculum lutulentum]MCH4551237.1 glycosyltransferase family 2 protein [Aestuariibaculum lutulentum]
MNPKVSIIMATYNRSGYILESLESIKNQTFKDWECWIVDDGSTDDTHKVLRPILDKDHRFKYILRTSDYVKGLPGARNYGLDLAKGDYIIFFDDDDIAHPQNLELCVKELTKDLEISFCRYIRGVFKGDFDYQFDYTRAYDTFYIDKHDINKILKNELQFNSCAVMWKKECFYNNRFQENLMFAEELELYTRIISTGLKGISIKKCLFYGRKHLDSNTGEFHNKDAIRRASFADAIQLVVANLKEKDLVSDNIVRYFIQISLKYKRYNLFERIMDALELTSFEKLKWQLFYKQLPLRLFFYRIKKRLLN